MPDRETNLPRPPPTLTCVSDDFFQAVLGLVAGLVVDVHVGALDVGQALELDLQGLGDVVGIAQGLLRGHDDVDFDDDARPAVVGANGVDGQDVRRVRHCYGC